ncbi:enoyl-CoA hydratase/isomerase family protein [candidate division TA06 bacterium]|nr:enoyl-CoA hydratase/isomerase family protein [candidate division TA06 bacterium]
MAKKLVDYHTEEGIAILELNNPPANAYTYEMNRDLDDAILQARLDESVHVIVITGKSERFFCAGADIQLLSKKSTQYKYYFALHANETFHRFEQTPKLVIAALNGHTLGGGLEIALSCDIRIAKKDGGKIGLPEVTLGVLPGTGGTQRLPRLIGKGRAMEMMTTGMTLSFEDALEIGLVHHVYEQEGFLEKVKEYAKQFLPPGKASKAVGAIKRSVQVGLEAPLMEALAVERELLQQLFESEDAEEGLKAYDEKRRPKFKGK